jgi:hypothetical protein
LKGRGYVGVESRLGHTACFARYSTARRDLLDLARGNNKRTCGSKAVSSNGMTIAATGF